MRSVAHEQKESDRRLDLASTPFERFGQVIELGLRDLKLFAKAHGLAPAEAEVILERHRQRGRRPSAVAEGRLR